MEEDREPQISNLNVFCLVGVSIFFDIVEGILDFIPVLGWFINIFIIDVFALLTFYVWFKILGISFIRTRRILAFASGFILGAIPFTSWFAWTLDVVLVIIDVRNQDILARFKKPLAKGQTPRDLKARGQQVGERYKRYKEAARKPIGSGISPK